MIRIEIDVEEKSNDRYLVNTRKIGVGKTKQEQELAKEVHKLVDATCAFLIDTLKYIENAFAGVS